MKKSLLAAAIGALTLGTLTGPAYAATPTPFGPAPVPLRDINPGSADSMEYGQVGAVLGSKLIFPATSSALVGRELWISDGTPSGTKLLKDILPTSGQSSNPGGPNSITRSMIAFKGFVYFSADDGVHGMELWRTDGTAAGTKLFKDLVPASTAGLGPQALTIAGGKLYFSGPTGGADRELWVSDGTSAGTKVIDINPGPSGSGPLNLTAYGAKLAFSADDGTHGSEPWVTSGTAATTGMLADVNATDSSTPGDFKPFGTKLLFHATGTTVSGSELWISDGTPGGTTQLLAEIHDGFNTGSVPSAFSVIGSTAIFVASDADGGAELWSTDGLVGGGGTQMLYDFVPGPGSNPPYGFTAFKGKVYFFAASTAAPGGHDLWVTDGKQGHTTRVKDLDTVYQVNEPDSLRVAGDKLVFGGGSTVPDDALWESDGTTVGTHVVDAINSTATLAEPLAFAGSGSTVFFTAVGGNGRELWAYTTRKSTTTGTARTYTKSDADHLRIRVAVRVSAVNATPTGKVTLRKGTTVVGTGTLSGGKVSIRITKKLARGSHTLKATYSGGFVARTSVSASFTIKVK